MDTKIAGDVELIPYISDSYYQLLQDLVGTSKAHPESISYPAGSIIIAVACIESYMNELVFMAYGASTRENDEIKRSFAKLSTDILKKIKFLKGLAKKPTVISDELLGDLTLLVSLRGKIVHYSPEGEHPNNKELVSKLEKLEKRLFGNKKSGSSVSSERILVPETAEISRKIIIELVRSLYRSGYEPPRPRWVTLIDPKRFGGS